MVFDILTQNSLLSPGCDSKSKCKGKKDRENKTVLKKGLQNKKSLS